MPQLSRSPFAAISGGVEIRLKATPKAKREGITGERADADGKTLLLVSVTAAPEDGKANAAILGLLAKTFGLSKSSLSVIAGQTDRYKRVRAEGDSATLLPAFEDWRNRHLKA